MLTHGRKAGELMTTGAFTATETTDLAKAAELMRRHRVKRLPALRDDHLCGIVSRADLVGLLGKVLSGRPPLSMTRPSPPRCGWR